MYVYMYIYIYVYVYMYVYMYICIHIHAYIYTCIYIYVYMYMCTCIYKYILHLFRPFMFTPLEGSSVNHEILKFIKKSKFTFTDVDNEDNNRLVRKCNSKHECPLCFNLKRSFHNSLIHKKYVTQCNDKNINILNCSTSNGVYLITCCRCGFQYDGETVQCLRNRFNSHRNSIKNPFADN